MSDRGPYGEEPEPTEAFPPLPPDSSPTPESLPPIGSERDPEPTTVMPPVPPPTESGIPTTAMPSTGGPFDPGPPYGGAGGGGGGGEEPPFEPEPDPWYRQPGPLAALIAGVAALIVVLIALLIWAQDDDDETGPTLPSIESTTSTTSSTSSTTSTTSTTVAESTTVPETTTTSTTTTTTTVPETTTTTTTTTTLPPTTTAAPTTTVAPTTTTTTPATTTTLPVVTIPSGAPVWDGINGSADLSTFRDALVCTQLDQVIKEATSLTVLAPTNQAMDDLPGGDPCSDPEAIKPILELHIVPNDDYTAEQIFGMTSLATQGGDVPVDRAAQTIGATDAKIIVRNVRGANGFLQVVNEIIQS